MSDDAPANAPLEVSVSVLDRPPGFAPADPTDGRGLGEWATRYPESAKKLILREAWYLAAILSAVPVLLLLVWLEVPKTLLGVSDSKFTTFARYSMSWIGGTLGGTLFAIKWLYHTVARQTWHEDRFLWRVFTPHISGGLSFVVAALIASDLVRIFDADTVNSNSMVVGAGFLVGYFSDSAIAKLSEVADTLFGTSRTRGETQKPFETGSNKS